MRLIDTLRIENAVQSYDTWLDLRGVRSRRRRELRRELRANLRAATDDVGVHRALAGIGSPRLLAEESSPLDPRRARWSAGSLWATLVFAAGFLMVWFTAMTVIDTVSAAGVVGRTVTTRPFWALGTRFSAEVLPGHQGMWWSFSDAWVPLVVLPLLTLVAVAQPWRALGSRKRAERVEVTPSA